MEIDTLDNSYKIKTQIFEGPFSLLLHLIEKRKFFINDLSLVEVTEDYLKYLNSLEKLDPEEASSFLVVASTLLLIKSKSLLPNLDLSDEEQGNIRDLEERLKLYELFNKLSINLKNNFGQKIIFSPLERKNDVLVFLPDKQISKKSMMVYVKDVLHAMPKKVLLPEVEVKKVVSIEEMLDRLISRIENTIKMSFGEFAPKGNTREDRLVVIVGFLAMLELVRQGVIHAIQEIDRGDILLEKREIEIEVKNL